MGVLIVGGGLIGYFSVFVTYKNALNKHDKLNELLNHPMARVAHGEQVERVTEHVKLMQEEAEAKKNNEKVQRLLAMAQSRKVLAQPQLVKKY